jgi:predicted helicase
MSQLLINQYLGDLSRLRRVSGANRESVVREAFKDLLKAWGRSHDLQFIPEHEFITPTKERRYIDGALLHSLRVPFGYWEAKDTNDDLDDEIAKKFRRGYPQTNIIFEDSERAVLIQNGQEVIRCAVDDVHALEKLLGLFFGYQRPEIADFRKAIEQFKVDLPEVLKALRERIDEAYDDNKPFAAAARKFLRQARETINPAVTDADVREMLIQHILTEDIFARVFGQSDFHRENNVAKALDALERLFFRGDIKQRTLHALEPYYAAIRSTAALIQSHSEKQGFLKAIYENFYKVYNPKAADRLGVVYIQTGVAIVFLVKNKGDGSAIIRYTQRPEMEVAEDKLSFLSNDSLGTLTLQALGSGPIKPLYDSDGV